MCLSMGESLRGDGARLEKECELYATPIERSEAPKGPKQDFKLTWMQEPRA